MTFVEMAAILVAVAFAVLVGYLVPMLIQVRKTVAESEQLLAKMNHDLPPLIGELRAMSQRVNDLTEQARIGSRACGRALARGRRSGGIGSARARYREGLERIDVDQCGKCGGGIESGDSRHEGTVSRRRRASQWRMIEGPHQQGSCSRS